MRIEFKSLDENKALPPLKGKVDIPANINIDTETGRISIRNGKERIHFSFVNKRLAKKWANEYR